MSIIRRASKAVASITVISFTTLALLELALRVYPAAIPMSFLVKFDPLIRGRIAAELKLPTRQSFRNIPRDDGGPELLVPAPGMVLDQGFRDVGAVNPQHTDAKGFCNEPGIDRDEGEIEILALGDSFTWCLAVPPGDAWPAQLADITGLKSYNLGIQAIGPHEYLQLLKWFGLAAGPKIVVMNIYEGNDYRDTFSYWAWVESMATGKVADEAKSRPQSGFLRRYSYVVSTVAAGYAVWREKSENQKVSEGIAAAAGNNDKASLRYYLATRNLHPDFRYKLEFPSGSLAFNPENGDLDEPNYAELVIQGIGDITLYDSALEEFVGLGNAYGFEPVVSYTPAAYTAYRSQVRFSDPSLYRLLGDFSDLQRRYFEERAPKIGYRFIDLTEDMQREAGAGGLERLLYFPLNRHLTPAGHRVVAETLARELGQP